MSLLNLGGPGWFSDVFELEITVDSEREVACHSLLFQEKCPLASTAEMLRGKVKVSPPVNRTVWHGGVSLVLDSTISFFESLSSDESKSLETELAPAGYLKEPTEFPFELDLSQLPSGFVESYDGEMFSVRHSLLATVVRPWWTFDVLRSLAVAVHKVAPAPAHDDHFVDDDLAAPAPTPSSPSAQPGSSADPASVAPEMEPSQQQPEQPEQPAATQHRLRVVDALQGLSMTYARSCMNLGESLEGVITLGGGNPPHIAEVVPARPRVAPLTGLQVVLYKIETGDGDSNEVIILAHDVDMGAEAQGAAVPAQDQQQAEQQEGEAQQQQQQQEPFVPPAPRELVVSVPLTKSADAVEFTPTIFEDAVQVRYYVRLLATDSDGNSFWNTHEVALFRASLDAETI